MTTENARTYAASADRISSGPLSKNLRAKFSMIRSICCASPGNLNVANISRNASSNLFPLKSNKLTNASRTSEFEGLAMYSPTIRLETREDFFKKRATERGFRSWSIIPLSARKERPSLGFELNFEAPSMMIRFRVRRARTFSGFVCSVNGKASCC